MRTQWFGAAMPRLWARRVRMRRFTAGLPAPVSYAGKTLRWRYGIALAMGVAAFLIRLLLYPLFHADTPILIAIVAVSLAAWFAGFGPGVLASVVGTLGGMALLLPPWGRQAQLSPSQDMRLALFLVTGLVVSGLTEALSQTTRAYLRAEQEQENRILQERNRMAREIHDTLAQGLTGIIVQLEAAEDTMLEAPDEAHAHIARAQDLARHSLTEARRSVQALRPLALEERDLIGALSQVVEQMTAGTGICASVTAAGVPPAFLTSDIQSNLLRIGTEALTNALKHARANTVRIRLEFALDKAVLSIRDDGRGFTPHSAQAGAGYGLTGMWERAERMGGQFTLVSQPGDGTEVIVTVAKPVSSNGRFAP